MKSTNLILSCILMQMLVACSLTDIIDPLSVMDEILFSTDDDSEFHASTKATAVTSLSSFYVSATKGSAGSETSAWTSTQFTSDGAATPIYSGGKWWPASNPSYHFYASNLALTFAAAGTTVAATNVTDVVCAYLATSTYGEKNTLTFNHIFARLGQVTVSASDGYTVTGVKVKITPKTGGTYNLRTGAWSATTDGTATDIAATIAAAGGTSQSNDIYLVPGTYTLTAEWTASKGDYSKSFSGKTRDITLTAGKVNKITATMGGDATSLTFGVSITAWTNKDVDAGAFPVY